jgi:uncharacterized protein YjlB
MALRELNFLPIQAAWPVAKAMRRRGGQNLVIVERVAPERDWFDSWCEHIFCLAFEHVQREETVALATVFSVETKLKDQGSSNCIYAVGSKLNL